MPLLPGQKAIRIVLKAAGFVEALWCRFGNQLLFDVSTGHFAPKMACWRFDGARRFDSEL